MGRGSCEGRWVDTFSGGRHGARAGALIGAVGGLVFVLVNAGAAGGPWPGILRVLGVENATLPWVAIVLGVHFLGFEKVFPAAGFLSLGVVLTVLGVVGLVLAVRQADRDLVTVVAGVASGFVLLGWVLRGVASGLGAVRPVS
jgi:hypothetical protein